MEVLRRLWTEPLVSFHGRHHHIDDAGLNPLPRQRPIPIWFGGHDDRVLRRAARYGDGWIPNFRSAADARPALEKLGAHLGEQGRSLSGFGLEARIPYRDGDPAVWLAAIEAWRQVGATHIGLNTMGAGLAAAADHLAAVRKFAEAVQGM